jgi:D-glycero-D-manno-heptose 1,7-bisphosphate phosphatase
VWPDTVIDDKIEAINSAILDVLPLQHIFVCYHDAPDDCECRKPRPGLLLEAAARYGSDLPGSVMVGDRWKDIEAGQNAGCATVLIDCGYAEPLPARPPDHTARSLSEAADWILRRGPIQQRKDCGHASGE